MYKDEIIEEVWKNRDEYVKSHNHSLDEILNDLKRRQNLSNHKFIDKRKTENYKAPALEHL